MTKNLGFCEIKFHNNYVICKVNEGINFTSTESDIQTQEILNFYQGKPFVYISHRVNSYSVNPAIYHKTSKLKNLIGFAVVSNKSMALMNVCIEELFLKKPIKAFATIEESIEWANNLFSEIMILK